MGLVGQRVDLHGLFPDQVDYVLSPVIEEAYRLGQTELTIIHGKGEGILRQAVLKVLGQRRHLILSVRRGEELLSGGEGWVHVSLKYKEINRLTYKKAAPKNNVPTAPPDLSNVIRKRERGREKYLRRMKREKQ